MPERRANNGARRHDATPTGMRLAARGGAATKQRPGSVVAAVALGALTLGALAFPALSNGSPLPRIPKPAPAAAFLGAGVSPEDGPIAAGAIPAELVIASPAPGTRTASVSSQISLLGKAALGLGASDISVTGSRSGPHSGQVERYSTGDGESFLPAEPFVAGETVTVRTKLDVAGAPSGTWSFSIGHRLPVVGHEPLPPLSTSAAGVAHYASAPGIEPPRLKVLRGAGSPGGDLFLAPKGNVGQAGPMILDPEGHLVWFDPLPGEEAFDLNEQQLGHEPVLTWFQGFVVGTHGSGEDVIANLHYQTIAVIRGGNGFAPDLHECQLLPDGVAYVTSYQALHEDLAPVGGSAYGLVWDSILQEIDVTTGLVEYEWHSLDHVGPALSVMPVPKKADNVYDYFHINSIRQLTNGDLLVSGRNTSAAYEVSPAEDGRVVWELGGRDSSFLLGSGATFWLQHDVEMPSPGTVTIFDDEGSPSRVPGTHVPSRALVEQLDLSTMTAKLVRAVTHSPPALGLALGNVETMPNGDLFVEWGTTQYSSQYSPTGAVLFDASLPVGDDTYRSYRHPWVGRPLTPPLIAFVQKGDTRRVVVSWNGATGVTSWRVLAGRSRTALHAAETVASEGFETGAAIPAGAAYIEVEALGTSGEVLGSSAVTSTS